MLVGLNAPVLDTYLGIRRLKDRPRAPSTFELTNCPLDRLYDKCPTICGHGPNLLPAVCESVYF